MDREAIEEFRQKATELLERAAFSINESPDRASEAQRIFGILTRASDMMRLPRLREKLTALDALVADRPVNSNAYSAWIAGILGMIEEAREAVFDEPSTEADATASSGSIASVEARSSNRRVLVVDDDADLAEILCDQLRSGGFEPKGLTMPEQALAAVLEFRPKLVITDFSMPNMTGLELIRRIRESFSDLPIIVLSGALDKGKLMDLMPSRLVATLEKPWDPKKLLELCDKAIAEPRPLQLLSRALDVILGQLALAPSTPEEVPELQTEITRLFEECMKIGIEDGSSNGKKAG